MWLTSRLGSTSVSWNASHPGVLVGCVFTLLFGDGLCSLRTNKSLK